MAHCSYRIGSWQRSSVFATKDSTLDDDAAIHHTILAYDPGAFSNAITKRFGNR